MHLKVLGALFLCSLVPRDVRAEHGLYLMSATFTWFVFNHSISGADAAWSRIRKTLRSIRPGLPTARSDNYESMQDDLRPVLTRKLKKQMKDLAVYYTINAIVLGDSDTVGELSRCSAQLPKSDGQLYVRKSLERRKPSCAEPHFLDAFFPVAHKRRFISCSSHTVVKLHRQPQVDPLGPFLRVEHSLLGDMAVRVVAATTQEAAEPGKLEAVLSTLTSLIYLPSPLHEKTPAEVQQQFRLLTVLDILTISSKYIVTEPSVPNTVILNMFLLHSAIECTVPQMLVHLKEQTQESPEQGVVQRTQASLSLQVLNILSKLRMVGLIAPSFDSESFVVSPNGNVYFRDFAPLFKEGGYYIQHPNGIFEMLERKKKKKKQKKGFGPLEDSAPDKMFFEADPSRNESDAARTIHEIWCLSRDSEGAAGGSENYLPDLELGAISEEEGATTRASAYVMSWSGCGSVPQPVIDLVESLADGKGKTLAGIAGHSGYIFLQQFAVSPTGH